MKVLKEMFSDSEIFLFGSFARGDWLEDGDVEILVISDEFEGIEYVRRAASLKIALWERGVIGVQIIPLTRREFEEIKEN
ncbi:MAG: nucleotidyltransferase domain-containing protein [Candidatus Jordarchaeales archaeon]|nr:nucleotidyltransferase domain-containing protein [Candidatus Jordarchaeia archaeon]